METKININNQPTINIGMIGSVSNGKSTVTEKLTGVKTQKHSKELERNITMKLGYANAKIFKCNNCPAPQCYQSHRSSMMTALCRICDEEMELKKHISICDVPGHSDLMAIMLNGTCIMDTTILVESANNKEPTYQTKKHLTAIGIAGLETKITCLNKVDLVKKDVAFDRIESLTGFLKGTNAEGAPIIPIAANFGINIDVLCEYICKYIKDPYRELNKTLKMIVVRSFNINKPNASCDKLEGGVVGGSIIEGVVNIGDKVVLYPGLITKNGNSSKWFYKPLVGKVLSINSETTNLDYALPGGLIGIKLDIDPGLTTNDRLVGNVVTSSDNMNMYLVYETLIVELNLINPENDQILEKDILIMNSNACNGKCEVVKVKKNKAKLQLLDRPICAVNGDFMTLSKNNIIIGRAKIIKGIESLLINKL